MVTTRCIDPDRLDEVLALPAEDPRRAHLAACPRCRALAEAYALFDAPPEREDAPHVRAADARLTAFRERMLAPDPAARAVVPPPRLPWWRALSTPAARPAWALAALVVVAGAWFGTARQHGPAAPGTILRGERAVDFALTAPVWSADGSVTLAWGAFAGADGYEVHLYATDLRELGRFPAGAERSVRVPAVQLPAPLGRGEAVLYRVVALAAGDEIGRSPVGTLERR